MPLDSDDPEQQRLLARFGRHFSAGKVIFEAGEPATEAFLLQAGRVRLIKRVGAAERSLRLLRPGDLFGETALVAGGTRGSTAVALVDGAALALHQSTFQQVLAGNPAVGMRVLQQLIRRLRDAEDQIEILMLADSQAKVVLALLNLTREALRSDDPSSNAVSLAVSPMELSARVGLDVETVKRNVQQLRNGQYLRISEERIEIPDVAALQELHGLLGVKGQIIGAASAGGSAGTPPRRGR